VANPADPLALRRIMNTPKRGIGPATETALQSFADANDLSLRDALSSAGELGLGPKVTGAILELADILNEVGATAMGSFEEAVRGADVVCACTSSAEPVLRREWLDPGTHLTSVGSSMDGPELDRETVTAGLLVVESRVAFEPPPAGSHELEGLDPAEAAELGEVLAGTRPGRTSEDQITVYKSMGHAVEDAVAAALVLELNSSES